MMANGQIIGDGSWDLIVHVTSLQTERSIRVKGDLHIGGVMLKLVEDLGSFFLNSLCLTKRVYPVALRNYLNRKYGLSCLDITLNMIRIRRGR